MNAQMVITTAMNVILHAGNARNLIPQAADSLVEGKWDPIKRKLKEAREELVTAHRLQTELLQAEAGDETIPVTVLFSHAQDTLMVTESELFFIETMYRYVSKQEEKR